MKMSVLIEFLDLLSENGIYAFTNGMIRNIFPGEPEGKRVRKKTLCNLTHLPPHIIDGIRAMLKGGTVYKDAREAFPIKRSLPHGRGLYTILPNFLPENLTNSPQKTLDAPAYLWYYITIIKRMIKES